MALTMTILKAGDNLLDMQSVGLTNNILHKCHTRNSNKYKSNTSH